MGLTSFILNILTLDFIKPWNNFIKPYNNHINWYLNTSPKEVQFLRDKYQQQGHRVVLLGFHDNPPQGITIDLVKEGVIELRYDPDSKHAAYPSVGVMENSELKRGFAFPYKTRSSKKTYYNVIVPFLGRDYNFGTTETTVAQLDPRDIEGRMFNVVRNLSDLEDKTIPVPITLVDNVVQLANEGKHDDIVKLLSGD